MGCLTIAELYQQQLDNVIATVGATVTYYPAVLTGYSTSTQARIPSEGAAVPVLGVFGKERVYSPEGAITYSNTFSIASGSYSGVPSPGDRIEHGGISYRVVELKRDYFGSVLTNYVLTLGN
jgi:hypothetical protein